MGPQAAARVKADNVGWLRENEIGRVETNAIYAVGKKPSNRRQRTGAGQRRPYEGGSSSLTKVLRGSFTVSLSETQAVKRLIQP
jgi:hypothetical protein